MPRGASYVGAADMAGNVWEWCQDWYHDSYDGDGDGRVDGPTDAPVDGSAWEDEAVYRVYRGASFAYSAARLTVAWRGYGTFWTRMADNGVRCVRSL